MAFLSSLVTLAGGAALMADESNRSSGLFKRSSTDNCCTKRISTRFCTGIIAILTRKTFGDVYGTQSGPTNRSTPPTSRCDNSCASCQNGGAANTAIAKRSTLHPMSSVQPPGVCGMTVFAVLFVRRSSSGARCAVMNLKSKGGNINGSRSSWQNRS